MPSTLASPIKPSIATTANRARVLLLTHRFPYPPNRGDRIRSYNMMGVLAEQFDVTLACPNDEPVSREQLQHVQEICSGVRTQPLGSKRWFCAGWSAIRGRSLTEGLFYSPELRSQVLDLQKTQPYDAVLVFCSSMFPYIDHMAFKDTPIVVDLVDVDSEKWRQMSADRSGPKSWIYAIESKRVRALEQRIAERADAITLVSDKEAILFKSKVQTQTPVIGVSNGVDTDYFRPADSQSNQPDESRSVSSEGGGVKTEQPSSSLHPSPFTLLFTGVLDYPPNVEGMVWFCTEILPSLRQRLDFKLEIVGRRPNQIVKELGSCEGVNLIGEVPDVRPYLHRADIAISPLKLARGIQNKVLEAMASGLPVVTTTQSAEGIDAINGTEFLIADTEDTWVEALCHLAESPQRRTSIGTAARDLVVNNYAWSARMNQIIGLVENAMSKSIASD